MIKQTYFRYDIHIEVQSLEDVSPVLSIYDSDGNLCNMERIFIRSVYLFIPFCLSTSLLSK